MKTIKVNQIEKNISYETLIKLSDDNVERLNRNINVEMYMNYFPKITTYNVKLIIYKLHHHYMGELTNPHFRCFVFIENNGFVGFQDVFIEQWTQLPINPSQIKILY